MFKVGDIVKGTENVYGVTNKSMKAGRVIYINKETGLMTIRVLKHENRYVIGMIYNDLEPTFFCKVYRKKKKQRYITKKDLLRVKKKMNEKKEYRKDLMLTSGEVYAFYYINKFIDELIEEL